MSSTISTVVPTEGAITALICDQTKTTATTATVEPTKPTIIPPAFVADSNGRKWFRSACRARGVSAKDHTPENAYLLIPEDVRHGYLLRCCHPWCARTGRLFRYCVVCRQAVSKRNFHKRHGHGLIRYQGHRSILPSDEQEEDMLPPPSSAAVITPCAAATSIPSPAVIPPVVAVLGQQDGPKEVPLVGTEEAMVEAHVAPAPVVIPSSTIVSDDESEAEASSAGAGAGAGAAEKKQQRSSPTERQAAITVTVTPEEMAWLQLFRERPPSGQNDSETMSKWFASIVSTCYPQSHQVEEQESPAAAETEPPPEPMSVEREPDNPRSDFAELDTFEIGIELEEFFEDHELDDDELDFFLD